MWKTRRPVVIAINVASCVKRSGSNQSLSQLEAEEGDGLLGDDVTPHMEVMHRYRYLVTTPGADVEFSMNSGSSSSLRDEFLTPITGDLSDDEDKSNRDTLGDSNHSARSRGALRNKSIGKPRHGSGYGTTTADNENETALPISLWEHPFRNTFSSTSTSTSSMLSLGGSVTNDKSRMRSNPSVKTFQSEGNKGDVSILSGHNAEMGGATARMSKRDLANLPYRTVVVDGDGVCSNKREDVEGEWTQDGVLVDVWDQGDGYTFRDYLKHLAEQKENKKLSDAEAEAQRTDENNSVGDSVDEDDSEEDSVDDDDSAEDIMYGQYDDDNFAGEEKLDTSSMDIIPQPKKKKNKSTLHLVCFHLPIKLAFGEGTGWTATWNLDSLISKSEESKKGMKRHFVGTVHNPRKDPATDGYMSFTEQDKNELRVVLGEMSCTPLFLDREIQSAHYFGMCKQVLWPAFHNIGLLDLSASGWGQRDLNPSSSTGTDATTISDEKSDKESSPSTSDWDQGRLDHWWEAYTLVNEVFANACISVVKPGDTIWVHDYHLSLVPKMVNDREMLQHGGRQTHMVFFLHIPFPTSQIFRELECGESILEGMLHADVVGFHAFDHGRHFLNATKRILGLSHESLVGGLIGVRHGKRVILVTMSNVSIETNLVDAALQQPVVQSHADRMKSLHSHRIILCGVDIAQRLSGISLKLLSFERLLTDYPLWRSKIVMVQKCLVPTSRRSDEISTLRELRFLVKRIQDQFGSNVIDYQEVKGSSLPIEKRLALWTASDVFVCTPIREGLNLLPLEYVYARKHPHTAGVVISSEFSAVSSILNGALRVNPFDIQMSATLLDKALIMTMEEREGRRARDIEFVSSCPSLKWTKNVLRDLKEAITAAEEDDDHIKIPNKDIAKSIAGFLTRENELNFSNADKHAIHSAYKATNRRVIVCDFNGTIVIKEAAGKYLKREILGSSGIKPPDAVIKALKNLCADPCNTVFVVSGDSQVNVENAIGNIPGLGLAASNGACFALPLREGENERNWLSLDLGVDWEVVKQCALPVLAKYTAQTNGSFIKLTHSSIGWSYYSSDPEWGTLQAAHLVLELEQELSKFDVRFVTLKGVVEVVPRRLNKGLIVKKILREVASRDGGDGVDFILCMGDDVSDEKMFTSVFSFVSEMDEDYSNVIPSPPVIKSTDNFVLAESRLFDETPSVKCKSIDDSIYAFTITVGKKPSHASQFVHDAKDVADILVTISGDDLPRNRSMSWDTKATKEDKKGFFE